MDESNRPARKWIRRALLLTVAAVLAWGLWTLIKPQSSRKAVPPPTAAPEEPAQMKEIRLTEIEEGDRKWILVAKEADYLKDENLIRLTGVEVEVFWEEEGNIILTGNSGYINTKTRQLTLEGEVQARLEDYRFNAPRVSYIPKERALVATGAVEIEGPQIEVEGRNLRIALDKKKLVLKEHLSTRWRLSEKEVLPR
ncbi:MAG: LPS export ABC transporter periplasmic protein LptC [Desulfobacteraceae bacterium]